MKSLHLHLLTFTYTPPPPPPPPSLPSFLLLIRPQNPPQSTFTSITRNPNFSSSAVLRQVCYNYRRWDSNAENFRTQNFNPNFENEEDEEEEDDEDGYYDGWTETDEWSMAVGKLIDDIWIFKVFKSYGWMLPGIITSFLLATGPKAFLMALALPLGQSAISLAFEKIWGKKQKPPKRKAKARKKPPRPRTSRKFKSGKEEKEQERQAIKKGKIDYESWVVGNNGPVNNVIEDGPTFGGWDELDRLATFDKGYTRKSVDGTRRTQKSKMSRPKRKSDMPLLLRLIIAIFPFLGSWTKML